MFPEWIIALLLRIKTLLRRRQLDRDLEEEIKFHLAMREQKLGESGVPADEAHYAARRKFGNATQAKEANREMWTFPFLETLWQDIRYGLRQLRRNPGFTAVAVITLALGIGANTAIFSVVDAVLLKPLRAPDPDRVVIFMNTSRQGSGPYAADIEFNLWRKQTSVLEDVSGFASVSYYLTDVSQPQKVNAMWVTGDYFSLFGLRIARGRGFTPEEELGTGRLFENGHVAVLSNGFWKSVFGGDRRILGKTISLSGNLYEIVGIMAPHVETESAQRPDVWLPFPMSPNSKNQVHYFGATGRLKPGVTLAMANAQLKLMTQAFRREYPNTVSAKQGDTYSVQRMRDEIVQNVRFSLLALMAAVSLVLFIACANAANLLLARAASRTREMAIRTALGAGRGRIIRQLLTESILLSIAGALLGLGVGFVGVRALLSLGPSTIPRIGSDGSNVTMDWRVLSFTIFLALITGVIFGLIPGLSICRTSPDAALSESTNRAGTGVLQAKARSSLVVIEVSLAFVLLVTTALFIRTLVALRSIDPGFDAHNVVTTRTPLDPKLLKTSKVDRAVQNAIERLDDLPGVETVGLTTLLPLSGEFNRLPVAANAEAPRGFGSEVFASPAYFAALKIPLFRGRFFTQSDRLVSAPVAIVNQTMARQLWRNGDAMGEQIIVGKGLGARLEQPSRQIVGIVGDVRENGLNLAPQPTVFIPSAQRPGIRWAGASVSWVIRTRTQSASLNTEIQNTLRQATGLPVPPLQSMEDVIAHSTQRQSFNMLLMSIFGASALVLAMVGLYGVMSYLVIQRTHEIGIRMALGAQNGDVLGMVIRNGIKLAFIGVGIGIAAAFGLTRFLASLLYGVKPTDPPTFIAVALILLGVALLACYIPARRAAKVDPIVALRHE
ncbi:MAG TPA: ABC transporter permease [Terriglobia bacterium]|nr:ABC transporter permease [Terriglobia bacterium]